MPVAMNFRVEATRASDEFKTVRRDIGTLLRDTVVKVGQTEVVPLIRSRMVVKQADDQRGLAAGAMASSIYVKRDRTTVIIASRLTGKKNRALGWIDFGGKRPNDTARRQGTHAILTGLDAKRHVLDDRLMVTMLEAFHTAGFEVS